MTQRIVLVPVRRGSALDCASTPLEHFVDETHRIAMREQFANFVFAEHVESTELRARNDTGRRKELGDR